MDTMATTAIIMLLTLRIVVGQESGSNRQEVSGNPFAAEEADERCDPCAGDVDASLSFDGLSCSEWLEYAKQVPANSEECTLERLLGWKFCGCPTHAEEKCAFCDGNEETLMNDLKLPYSSITCEAFVDLPKIDGDLTCDLARNFASYCGCQSAVPQCSLCADGAPPQNIDAPLYLGMTCADIQDLYLVSSSSRCGAIEADYPFDLQAYCGCSGATKPDSGCDFCPYGGELQNYTQTLQSDETSTCGAWANLASFAREGESSCAVFQYVGLECCDNMELPEFFTNNFDETEDEFEDPPTLDDGEQTEQQQPENEQEVESESKPPKQAQTSVDLGFNTDPTNMNETQVETGETDYLSQSDNPFDVTEATLTPAPIPENISSAIQVCFAQHTGATNSEVVLSHLKSVQNETVVEKAQEELGDLFDSNQNTQRSAQPDVNRGSANIGSTAAKKHSTEHNITGSPIVDLSKDPVATEKWDKLFQDLANIDIPSNFMDMVPKESKDLVFLDGLSFCLERAVDTFTHCFLCPGGKTPSKTDKMIPVTGLYCDELDAWRADASAQECKSLNTWLPFDMASWCGCPGIPDRAILYPPTNGLTLNQEQGLGQKCSFCPEGSMLVLDSWRKTIQDKTLLEGYEEDSTCAEWAELADYTTTEEGCTFLQRIASSGCCEAIGDTAHEPTPAPFPIVSSTTFVQPPTALPTTSPLAGKISVNSGASLGVNWNGVFSTGLSLAMLFTI